VGLHFLPQPDVSYLGAPAQMLNDSMEAIHEIPRMLVDWDRHNLEEVKMHLGCFPAGRWPGAPDLVKYFDQKLTDYGHTARQ
jgi:hypothetical protein